MVKDTVDVWRAVNGLLTVTPVTTYESIPGSVSRATWSTGNGAPIALVTITHGRQASPRQQMHRVPGSNRKEMVTAQPIRAER